MRGQFVPAFISMANQWQNSVDSQNRRTRRCRAHIGILMVLVSDAARSRAFYSDLLGFDVVEALSSPGGDFVYLHSKGGNADIALQDASKQDYGVPTTRGGLIIGFAVDDADAVYQEWQSKSVEFLSDVFDMGAGRMFTVKDPDGNYIQVYHLYPQVLEMRKLLG